MTANRRRTTNPTEVKARCERRAHRIRGLIRDLETQLENHTDDAADWCDAGTLDHIENHIADLLVSFRIKANQSESECKDQLLASVDPEGIANIYG
jgi:hypothetical protein